VVGGLNDFHSKNIMTQNTQKSINLWTEEHDAFCFEHRIAPAAKQFWQWLVYRGEEREHEPDLTEEFNTWVAKKRGKPYDPKTLKTAVKQLTEHSIINILRKFSWKTYRFFLRPLDWLMPKKKVRNSEQISKIQDSNPPSADEEVMQQQQSSIEDNTKLLADNGIYFNEKEKEVLERPTVEIKLALAMFELRGGHKEVQRNPEGWIRTCLRCRFWDEPRNYLMLLKYFLKQAGYDSMIAIDLEDAVDLAEKSRTEERL
jgi:hypothetical protein